MKSMLTKIVIVSIIFVLIIGALIFFGVYPEMSKYSTNKSELSETRARIEEAEFKLSELNKLKNNSAEIKEVNDFVVGLLPENKSTSDFVVKSEAMTDGISVIIDSLTTGSGTSFKKSATAASNTTEEKSVENSIEFTITSTNGYNTILDIIKRLESFPRFNIIDTIYISGRSRDTGYLNLRLIGRIFYGK